MMKKKNTSYIYPVKQALIAVYNNFSNKICFNKKQVVELNIVAIELAMT